MGYGVRLWLSVWIALEYHQTTQWIWFWFHRSMKWKDNLKSYPLKFSIIDSLDLVEHISTINPTSGYNHDLQRLLGFKFCTHSTYFDTLKIAKSVSKIPDVTFLSNGVRILYWFIRTRCPSDSWWTKLIQSSNQTLNSITLWIRFKTWWVIMRKIERGLIE